MNPKLLFWIPALLRMTFILAGAGIFWWLFGAVWGLAVALLSMIALLSIQLHYLFKLGD